MGGTAVKVAAVPAAAGRMTWQARCLVEAVIAYARARVELIQLSVVVGNEQAHRLYARLGFVEYGIERNSLKYCGRYYDEILMAKELGSDTDHDAVLQQVTSPQSTALEAAP